MVFEDEFGRDRGVLSAHEEDARFGLSWRGRVCAVALEIPELLEVVLEEGTQSRCPVGPDNCYSVAVDDTCGVLRVTGSGIERDGDALIRGVHLGRPGEFSVEYP